MLLPLASEKTTYPGLELEHTSSRDSKHLANRAEERLQNSRSMIVPSAISSTLRRLLQLSQSLVGAWWRWAGPGLPSTSSGSLGMDFLNAESPSTFCLAMTFISHVVHVMLPRNPNAGPHHLTHL